MKSPQSLARPHRTLVRRVALALLVLSIAAPLSMPLATNDASAADAAPAQKTWSGTWNNKKFGTSGPLTCTATIKDKTTWNAKFRGKGIGKNFNYDAVIKVARKNNQVSLTGTTDLSGDSYRWSGRIQGKYLVGTYRSSSGNNGSFRLQAR